MDMLNPEEWLRKTASRYWYYQYFLSRAEYSIYLELSIPSVLIRFDPTRSFLSIPYCYPDKYPGRSLLSLSLTICTGIIHPRQSELPGWQSIEST